VRAREDEEERFICVYLQQTSKASQSQRSQKCDASMRVCAAKRIAAMHATRSKSDRAILMKDEMKWELFIFHIYIFLLARALCVKLHFTSHMQQRQQPVAADSIFITMITFYFTVDAFHQPFHAMLWIKSLSARVKFS
jgi:hypothetical protein